MKVLSLLQPWASLVVKGAKKIETRTWSTSHRGELAIHASSGKKAADVSKEKPFSKYIKDFNALPFGAIIGKVTLVDVVRIDPFRNLDKLMKKISADEKAFDDFTEGRYAWILEDPIEFETIIPVKGSLGIWHYAE
jgi:activating signal cointegrator 1